MDKKVLFIYFLIIKDKWKKNYPNAKGEHQSPINLKSNLVIVVEGIAKLSKL